MPRFFTNIFKKKDTNETPDILPTTEVPKEKQYAFNYVKLNGQVEGFRVKYYQFVGDFIRLTLVDNSEVVLTSKDTVLDRFTIKEIKNEV